MPVRSGLDPLPYSEGFYIGFGGLDRGREGLIFAPHPPCEFLKFRIFFMFLLISISFLVFRFSIRNVKSIAMIFFVPQENLKGSGNREGKGMFTILALHCDSIPFQ